MWNWCHTDSFLCMWPALRSCFNEIFILLLLDILFIIRLFIKLCSHSSKTFIYWNLLLSHITKLMYGHCLLQVLRNRFSLIIGRQSSWALMTLMVITKPWSILQEKWFWLTSYCQNWKRMVIGFLYLVRWCAVWTYWKTTWYTGSKFIFIIVLWIIIWRFTHLVILIYISVDRAPEVFFTYLQQVN